MPLKQSEAFILRTFPVGEQDKIVIFFTKERGIIKGIAKGARKFGNRFGSTLEPMSYVKIFYYEKERKDLVVVNKCDLLESFFELHKDLKTAFTLSYFSEILEGFFPSRSKEDILFRLLRSLLTAFKQGGNVEILGAYFEAWVIKISGILPSFKSCKKCQKEIDSFGWLSTKKDGIYCNGCALQRKNKVGPEVRIFLKWVQKNPPTVGEKSPLSFEQIVSIRKILQSIIIFHMEKKPKSLNYLN